MSRQSHNRQIPSIALPILPPSPSWSTAMDQQQFNRTVYLDAMATAYLISRSHLLPAMIMGTKLGVLVFLLPRNDCCVTGRRPPIWHLVSMICDRNRATSSNDSRLSTLKTNRNRSPGQQQKNIYRKVKFRFSLATSGFLTDFFF